MYRIALLMICILALASTANGQDLHDMVQHGYINNDGVKIHYTTLGEGQLMVMVHGFPDYWYTWRNLMAHFAKEYQVVAIDLRGYNKSDKPKGVDNYTMPILMKDVVSTINHFPQDKAILIGHDWGGAIAWQVGIWYPHLVDKLIILSTPHPNGLTREINTNSEQKKNSQYALDFQKKDAYKSITMDHLTGWIKDKDALSHYKDAFKRSDYESMLNYYTASYPRSNTNANRAPAQQNTVARRIKSPTLTIFGLEDKAFQSASFNGTWDWIDSDFTLVSIPGAGHFVQHDASEIVITTINSWLKR